MPIVPVESPTMQTSRPTVLSGPTLLLSRTPLRGTKQPPLEPVLSPCERDHELFGEHYRFAFRDSESSLHARLLICSCPVLLQMLMHIPCIRFSLLLQSTTHLLQPGDLLRLQLDDSRRVCCPAICNLHPLLENRTLARFGRPASVASIADVAERWSSRLYERWTLWWRRSQRQSSRWPHRGRGARVPHCLHADGFTLSVSRKVVEDVATKSYETRLLFLPEC